MYKFVTVALVAFFVSAGVTAFGAAQENAWMKSNVGDWVKHKNVTHMKMGGTVMNTTNITTKTLAKKDDKGFTLHTVTDLNGSKTEQDTPMPATYDYGKMGKVEVKEIGEETITVGGKTYTCKLTETIVDMGGKKSVTKLWQSEEVPSGTVKSVTQNDMMTSTVELVEYGKK